jgi:hypothetical protein
MQTAIRVQSLDRTSNNNERTSRNAYNGTVAGNRTPPYFEGGFVCGVALGVDLSARGSCKARANRNISLPQRDGNSRGATGPDQKAAIGSAKAKTEKGSAARNNETPKTKMSEKSDENPDHSFSLVP